MEGRRGVRSMRAGEVFEWEQRSKKRSKARIKRALAYEARRARSRRRPVAPATAAAVAKRSSHTEGSKQNNEMWRQCEMGACVCLGGWPAGRRCAAPSPADPPALGREQGRKKVCKLCCRPPEAAAAAARATSSSEPALLGCSGRRGKGGRGESYYQLGLSTYPRAQRTLLANWQAAGTQAVHRPGGKEGQPRGRRGGSRRRGAQGREAMQAEMSGGGKLTRLD